MEDNKEWKGHLPEVMEDYREQLEKADNSKFLSRNEIIDSAIFTLCTKVRAETGYNLSWLANEVRHSLNSKGRPAGMNVDDRRENSVIVYHLVNRGASKTQAIIFLGKLKGQKVVTEGFQKDMGSTYKEFVESGQAKNIDLEEIGWIISGLLEIDYNRKLESDEKAFEKAITAYDELWEDILNLMREFHPIIKQHDNAYPDIFGDLPDLIEVKNIAAWDLFYNYKVGSRKDRLIRSSYLNEFLNTISFFKNNFPKREKAI